MPVPVAQVVGVGRELPAVGGFLLLAHVGLAALDLDGDVPGCSDGHIRVVAVDDDLSEGVDTVVVLDVHRPEDPSETLLEHPGADADALLRRVDGLRPAHARPSRSGRSGVGICFVSLAFGRGHELILARAALSRPQRTPTLTAFRLARDVCCEYEISGPFYQWRRRLL